jgi:RimJ/RimL family protein N-acetyltransferase
MTMRLRAAGPDDIAFIMACERRPGYELLVGRWTEERHRAAIVDPGFRYFIAEDDSGPRGFAIVQTDVFHVQNLYLKRIAVHDPGRGHGKAVLRLLNDWVFADTDTHRFWLEVVEKNPRATRVYESLGFVVEGVAREVHAGPDGRRGSFVQMSLIRPDWVK